jgi:hypothetical protein
MYFSKYSEEKIQEEKIQEENIYQEQNYQDKIDLDKLDNYDNVTKNIPNKIANNQYINLTNYKKSIIPNEKFITDNIFSNDIDIENKIYNMIFNPYQKKLNLINLVLNLSIDFKLKSYLEVIKFFNWLYPLTIEYKMASGCWNIKMVKYANREKVLLQNSISKSDLTDNFNKEYITKIKNILCNSGIKYYYFEFKSKRFNKIKDIIWAFDKN